MSRRGTTGSEPTTAASALITTSQVDWPFSLNTLQLASSRDFLLAEGGPPRILRIFGTSGSGKSFLARELMVQSANHASDGIGVYLDVPPSDLEASALLVQIEDLLLDERVSSRDAPSFVGKKASRSWRSLVRGPARGSSYAYQVSRELIAQVPLVGPFIKALLPEFVPIRENPRSDTASLRFLMKRSESRRVFLAIDNTQFIPFAVREALSRELAGAGPNLRLILIERLFERPRIDWVPKIEGAETMDVELGNASEDEVLALVTTVLPEAHDVEKIASVIFRRSGGNLKAIWFQLRLISAQKDAGESPLASYEDVIETLSELDVTVLRAVVFTLGGLTISNLVALLEAFHLGVTREIVATAIRDLADLGLLVVERHDSDRVRVEHELVAQVVSRITPEEEKLELRHQVVSALSRMLDSGSNSENESILYDRLIGIVAEVELRQTPSLLAHVERFIRSQSELERYGYLASICRDSVCWEVLDILPESTIRLLLDAIQKTSLFSFGLVVTAKLKRFGGGSESVASLYEAKYLVQLFRYEEAQQTLNRAAESKEKRSVEFNILLGLAQDEKAAEIALEVYAEASDQTATEQDFVILRNSAHLFELDDARVMLETAVQGFRSLGRDFGLATALNNLGIVELFAPSRALARTNLEDARCRLADLGSSEIYQPLANLSALALLEGDVSLAMELLSRAREAAPRSLAQDDVMFRSNELALKICESGRVEDDDLPRARSLARAARNTRDLRFIEIVSWFSTSLEVACGVDGSSKRSTSKIQEIRTSKRVPIEIFIPVGGGKTKVEVPYVLSPHWRY